MAYAWDGMFPGISGALGVKGDDDEPQQQNIFGDQTVQADPSKDGQPASQQGPLPVGQNGAQVKTSTDTDVGTGGGPSGAAGGGNESAPAAATQQPNRSNVIRRNIGQTSKPAAIGRAQNSVEQADQDLQAEANAYTTGYQGVDTSLKNEDIDAAIGGDEGKMTAASARLAPQGTAERQARFDPKTDYEIKDIGELQTDAGTKGLLRRDADEQYNAGEAAFDMQLLRRDPDFNLIRSNLLTKQNALRGNADTMVYGKGTGETKTKSLSEQAQEFADKEFETSGKAARDYLETKDDEILKGLQDKAAAENAARTELRKSPDQAFLDAERAAIMEGIMKDANDYDPNYAKGLKPYLEQAGVDIGDYYGVSGDVGHEDLVTEAEANPFNSIMQLLGRGDTLGKGKGVGARQSVNRQAYQDAVMKKALDRYNEARAAIESAQNAPWSPFGDAYDAGGFSGFEGAGVMPPPPPPPTAAAPTMTDGDWMSDLNAADKAATGNTVLDPLATGREDLAKEASTADGVADKAESGVKTGAKKTKKYVSDRFS